MASRAIIPHLTMRLFKHNEVEFGEESNASLL
jgi:hypothetical protein